MIYESVLLAWSHVTIEPYLFFYTTGLTLAELSQQNLIAEKICRVSGPFNSSVCDALSERDLSEFAYADNVVQQQQSQYSSYGRLIQSIFPCLLAMTWGSWGDKHQRRIPPLLVAAFGEFLKDVLLMACVYIPSVPAHITYLLQILVPAITGGNIVVQMASTSYLADITNQAERTHRIGVATVVGLLAYPVGYFLSGIVNRHLGFYGVFGICALLNLINLVYLSQWVKESFVLVKPRESGEQSLGFRELLVDFFRWTHIQTTIKFAFSRVGDRRQRIFVSSLLVLFAFAPIYGEFDIVYLFVRRKFHWNIAEFSLYLTMSSLVAMIVLGLSTYILSNRHRIPDYVMGVLASALKIGACLLFAFGRSLMLFYIATFPDSFYVIAGVAVRSSITKLVKEEEQGRMNAFTGGIEALVFCLSSSFYAYIYARTLVDFPGAIYLISVALAAMGVIAFWYQMCASNKEPVEQVGVVGAGLEIGVLPGIPGQII